MPGRPYYAPGMCARKVLNPLYSGKVKPGLRRELLAAEQAGRAGYLPRPQDICRPLVIFLGGFRDSATGRFYNTARAYRDEAWPGAPYPPPPDPLWPGEGGAPNGAGAGVYQDIYYRTHDTRNQVRLLMALYQAAGQPVVLVGHSWGGASAYKAALRSAAPVALLVTLDPVSVFPLGERRKPASVARWINVWLDFGLCDRKDPSNRTARLGRPWGGRVPADEGHDFIATWPEPGLPGHAWCAEMFNYYARAAVAAIRS